MLLCPAFCLLPPCPQSISAKARAASVTKAAPLGSHALSSDNGNMGEAEGLSQAGKHSCGPTSTGLCTCPPSLESTAGSVGPAITGATREQGVGGEG